MSSANQGKPPQRETLWGCIGAVLAAIIGGVFLLANSLLSRPEPPQATSISQLATPLSPSSASIEVSLPTATSEPPTAKPAPSPIRSTFDDGGPGGWKINYGQFSNPGSGGGCGADNGCLIFVDSDASTSWWIAPPKYHGDWRSYSNLKLDLWSSGGTAYTDDYGDIYVASGSATAQRRLSSRPPDKWRTYEVPLVDDGEWIVDGAQNLSDVLANVTDFQIRAEYGDPIVDKSGLDNVELVR